MLLCVTSFSFPASLCLLDCACGLLFLHGDKLLFFEGLLEFSCCLNKIVEDFELELVRDFLKILVLLQRLLAASLHLENVLLRLLDILDRLLAA